ncbi:MAG: hypothetical protein IMF02_15030, partial [Proteobacteria bacterium]|nr:hypothetical protein [Pseudomonadota bacterium]
FWLSGHQEIEPERFFTEALEIYEAIETKDEVRLKAATIAHVKVSLDKIMGLS